MKHRVVVFAFKNEIFKEVVPGRGLRIEAIRKIILIYPIAIILIVF